MRKVGLVPSAWQDGFEALEKGRWKDGGALAVAIRSLLGVS